MSRGAVALLVLGSLLVAPALAAKKPDRERAAYIRANYTKYEYRIPMRDGKRLFTAVYLPNARQRTYPILMYRTPYSVGPYGADGYRHTLGPYAAFEKEGFVFVFQDVRGRFMSEGTFVNMRPHAARINESTDTFDTIEWLLKHVKGHNGKVGMRGISYPGFYAAAGAIDSHPALKAISPQAPIADWFWDDMHHHGATILPLTMHTFKRGHRMMIQVQSTWFPLVDLNPQKYVPNIFWATRRDFVSATHRVHRSMAHASRVKVRVLPQGDSR